MAHSKFQQKFEFDIAIIIIIIIIILHSLHLCFKHDLISLLQKSLKFEFIQFDRKT